MAFNKEFFDGLGEALTKTAKDISEKAGSVYETQKIRSRIASEERTIEKLKSDIGNLIFSRFEAGEMLEGELGRLCRDISERLVKIETLEKENASLRGKKICPSCRKEIPMEALFCPSCGTSCPNPEPEEEAPAEEETSFAEDFGTQAEEAFENAAEEAETFAGAAQEMAQEVTQDAAQAVDDVLENAAGTAGEWAAQASEKAEELVDEAAGAAEEAAEQIKNTAEEFM